MIKESIANLENDYGDILEKFAISIVKGCITVQIRPLNPSSH